MCGVIVGIALLCVAMSFIIKSGDDAATGNAFMEEAEMTPTLLNKSFPICRTISYYIEAYTLINRSFEFHFMKTV